MNEEAENMEKDTGKKGSNSKYLYPTHPTPTLKIHVDTATSTHYNPLGAITDHQHPHYYKPLYPLRTT